MNHQTYTLHANDPGRALVKANAHAFIDRLPESKPWEIEIRPRRKTRSAKQRKSLFGVAYKAIMDATGLQGDADKRQLHRDMCGEFYGWTDGPLNLRKPVRTTTRNERGEPEEITTVDALELYAFIQRKAAEFGIDVPDPDPLWREKAVRERLAA